MKPIINLASVSAACIVLVAATMVFSLSDGSRKPIIFDHGLHVVENDLTCEDCHESVELLPSGGRSIPNHDVCADCHEVGSPGECGSCHVDPNNPVGMAPAGEFYAGFAHKQHRREDIDCSTCHANITSIGMEPVVPGMQDCLACHHKRNGPLNCGECHQGKRPKPNDHSFATWIQDHGLQASAGVTDCAMCHEQSGCDECHQGINLYGNPHPPNWVFNHFAESSYGGECMVCHETREKCVNCHRATRPAPHPLNGSYSGETHEEDARAFIEVCLACHDVGNADPTCVKCHD